ncbi:MAG: hypothetical protein ABGW78_06655 [Pirellulales bacterium]
MIYVFILFASIAGTLGAVFGVVCVRGSTAVSAAVWALAAWMMLAFDVILRGNAYLTAPGTVASMRLVVVSLSVCPAMSLLGAKRPQHGVWQFIVASLACILVLPVGRSTVVLPGSMPSVHVLAAVFMVVLIFVGWMNFIATRRGLAATLIACAQLIYMAPFLPGFKTIRPNGGVEFSVLECSAVIAAASGTLLAVCQACCKRKYVIQQRTRDSMLSRVIDPPFLAFRETFGAAWALRVAERFNQIAASREWPCKLSFRGLDDPDDDEDERWHRDAERAFLALMHRFVSPAWLTRHGVDRTDRPRHA